MVEFALVFPLFFLIVLATIDFGWALRSYITITNSAREGARLAVTLDPDDSNTISLVQEHASNHSSGLVTESDVTVAFPDGAQTKNPVEVTVEYEHNFITPLGKVLGFFSGGSIDDPLQLASTSTMRIE